MNPVFIKGNVKADCPDCGVPSTFEFRNPDGSGEFGSIIIIKHHNYKGVGYPRLIYKLLCCTVCNRP